MIAPSVPGLHVEDTGGGVWDVRLARPEAANALTRRQLEHLGRIVSDARSAGQRVLVFSGEGSHFSAGMDFAELTATAEDEWVDDVLGSFHRELAQPDLVTIGAIHGACVGAAFDLALALDLLVAEEDAFFQLPAARFGLLYREDVVRTLVDRAGTAGALRILALGERLGAREARASRLVSEIAESGRGRPRAVALAREAVEANIWEAVSATKGLIRALSGGEETRARWDRVRRELIDSPERRARVAAAQEQHVRAETTLGDEKGE